MLSSPFVNDCNRWGLTLNIVFNNGVKCQVVHYCTVYNGVVWAPEGAIHLPHSRG